MIMKILLINKFFYIKGGSETAFFEIAKLLEKKGHKVSFFSMQHPNNFATEYEKYFISNKNYAKKGIKNAISASLKLLYSLDAARKIERLIRNERPDIAHLHNIYHQISPAIIHVLKRYRIPIVMTLHDYKIVCGSYKMLADRKPCEACMGKRYYQCLLKKCVGNSMIKSLLSTLEMYLHHRLLHIYDLVDVFIAPSEFLKNKIVKMGFERKSVLLHYFFPTDKLSSTHEWSEKAIVYFGRLSSEKGVSTLIDAVKGLDITLNIVGEGPIGENLKLKVKSEKLDNIRFLGYKTGEELRREIKKSMFVVLPSEWYENYPFSIIETFSLGKPVIGSRIGGIPELVKDNERGLTFESGNRHDLRSKIEYLMNDSDKIAEMGKNARAFVEKELNAEKHYEQLMEIYSEAVELNG